MNDTITLPRAVVQAALGLLDSAHVATKLIWDRHDTAEALRAALAAPQPSRQPLSDDQCKPESAELMQRAFAAGWMVAAAWANRDDLLADMWSPAYLVEMAKALNTIGAAPQPAVPPEEGVL